MESPSLSSLASSSSNSLGQSQLGSRDVGRRVCYTLKGGEERRGVLHYIGQPDFASGEWVGIVLDRPEGKNNGSVQGIRYFSCDSGYGVFVRSERVTLDPRPAPRSQPTSRPGSRPLSRHGSRHPSREGSPVIQRKGPARTEVDGIACSRYSSHLPRIPPGDVVPGSDLDHLLKALQPSTHTITTSPPKKRGPLKAFAMKTTRDGARSAVDRNIGAAYQTVGRCKSSMHLSSPKTDRPKARRANSVDMLSSGSQLRPKSPKRERKPTDEGKGGSKGKSEASPKKPKINTPLGKQPKTSTPKDATLLSSVVAKASSSLQSEQGESPFPSQGTTGGAFKSPQKDSPSPASCSTSSHCSAAMLSASVAPDSYSITPSRVEMDASVGNPGNQAFMQTPQFQKPVSPFNEGACTSLSRLDQLASFPYQSPSFGMEHHTLSLCQPQALLGNTNNSNSYDGCRKPKTLVLPLEMHSLPKQLKESVGSLHYDPPHYPLPQPTESAVRVKYTNRRSGASMSHPLAAVTTTPQSTPPPQPQPQPMASQPSLAVSLTQSRVTEDTLHSVSLSPPSDDAISVDSGRPQSHDTSSSPSSLVDSQSPLTGSSACISPEVEQSTLVFTESQLEEVSPRTALSCRGGWQRLCCFSGLVSDLSTVEG